MGQHHPQQDWRTCQLLVALHEQCVLPTHYISCESLKGKIPLTKLYGVTPDTSIIMMYTFYQSVYYASQDQSFPSTSGEKHAFWVLVNMSVMLSQTNSDSSSNKIIYKSAVCPADDIHPNKHFLTDLGSHNIFLSHFSCTYNIIKT